MENSYLDQLVKHTLQQLDVEYQAETWHLLEEKLGVTEDVTQLDDAALDTIVGNALQDYEVPYTNDWTNFSQRLEDNIIDTTILGALQNIEVPSEDNHWAVMSEKLDEEIIDSTILGALSGLEVPYEKGNWAAMSKKLDEEIIDSTILSALSGLEIPYEEGSWAAMSEKLDEEIIDNTILSALSGLEIPYEAGNWAAMSEKLDEEIIDNTILGALSGLEIPYEAGNWAAMSEKLDSDVLDNTVFEALNSLSVVYNENHWMAMSKQLDAIFARPFEIIRYKLLELALLFLLFFGIGQYIPADMPKMEIPVAEHSIDQTNKPSVVHSSPQLDVVEEVKNTKHSNVNKIMDSEEKTSEKSSSKIKNTPQTISKSDKKTTKKTGHSRDLLSKVPALVTAASDLEKKEVVQINSANSNSEILAENNPIINDANESIDDNVTNSNTFRTDENSVEKDMNMSALVQLPLTKRLSKDIPFLNKEKENDLEIVSLVNIPTKKKANIRVGMFASANGDFISTPYDPVLGLDPYRQSSVGYGGGISLGWKYNRWEVETAISYMAKRYHNRPFIHIFDGSVVEGYQANFLTGIELNIINIPLHFNYHIINREKWHVYGLTGGTMQVILQANYDANREELGGGVGTAFTGGTKVTDDNNKSLFSRKDFNSGLLADEKLKENSYYSIDLGMGLERYISPYWNVFIQPTYQYNLPEIINTNGLGPNNDKINTFQLLIGVKSNLN